MKSFWSTLYKSRLADEPLVGKIHLIEELEGLDPYNGAGKTTYFHRIRLALGQLPSAHREAALLVFSSVLYFPKKILDDIWRFLWFEMRQLSERHGIVIGDAKAIQFFEVDPADMVSDFAHLNGISGRLDTDSHARVGDIVSLTQLLRNLSNTDRRLTAYAADEVRLLSSKRLWVILTDKALSGQSLANDLKRYLEFAGFLNSECGAKIRIVVLAQIMTAGARRHVVQECQISSDEEVTIVSGAELGSDCKANSPDCGLFARDLRNMVEELCQWFAETYLITDSTLDRMRRKSGDNLAFGYKGVGVTVCDSLNCPTDSLPLLWYESARGQHASAVPVYKGPYPRIHSRIGDQHREPLGSQLSEIPDWKESIRRIF